MQKDNRIDTTEERQEKILRTKYNRWIELKTNLIYSPCIGAGFTFIVAIAMLFLSNNAIFNLMMSLHSLVMVSIASFIFLEWRDVYVKRCIEGEAISEKVENSIARFLAINPYSNILINQLKLTWQLMEPFSIFVDKTTENGGVVISANSIEYMKHLEAFLEKASKSYKAILCGYDEIKNKCIYRPKWFFVKGDDLSNVITDEITKEPMMERSKSSWLLTVMKKEDLPRDRIMILQEKELFEDFSIKAIRDQFLDMHSGEKFRLFFASIDEIKEALNSRGFNWKNMIEDYAIIDDSLVLKHDYDSSLLFASIASAIQPFREIFKILDEDDSIKNNAKIFKKLTKDHINNESWDSWIIRKEKEYASH